MTSTYDHAIKESVEVSRMVKSYREVSNFFPAVYWLSELYQHMVTRGEITEIRMLPSSEKMVIWTEVCLMIPEKPKWIKILAAQAAYMWSLIIEKSDNNE